MHTRTSVLALTASVAVSSFAGAQPLTLSRADYPSEAGARAIATADFDRNGWADIATANTGRDTVTILLNRIGGAEGFTRRFDVPVGHGPFDMVTADFNLDGKADLAIAAADADSLSILLGRGDGRFTRTDVAAPGNPRGITTTDFNRDGRPDIVYTAFGINRVQVLLGNGAGGFTQGSAMNGIAQRPQGVAAADFNKDGRVDFAVTYASPGGLLAILYANPTTTWTVQTVAGEDNLNVVTTGDFDKDGWLDVAAASTGNSRLVVYPGSATGFRHAATYQTGASPRGLEAADVTHDGLIDLITANRESNTVNVFTGRASSPGSFTSREFAAGRGSRDVVAADFNHDGRLDPATGNQDDGSATVLWNDTRLMRPGLVFTFGPDQPPRIDGETVVADLNHNGRLDRVFDGGNVLMDDGARLQLDPSGGHPVVTDLNGDGHPDVAFLTRETVRMFFGDGRGGFGIARTAGAFTSSGRDLGIADVNRDGRPDLIVNAVGDGGRSGALHILPGRGDGTFGEETIVPLPTGVFEMTVADLNLDGNPDVLASPFIHGGPNFYVLFGDGRGGFARTDEYAMSRNLYEMEVGDVNEDGRPDVVGGTFGSILVLLGTGDGRLAEAGTIKSAAYRVGLGDVNADGHLDIVGNAADPYSSQTGVSFGAGDGSFGPPQGFVLYSANPVIADMNRDAVPDIVLGGTNGIMYGQRNETNRAPVADAGSDVTVSYHDVFNDDEEDMLFVGLDGHSSDPDLHSLTYEWRDAAGTVLFTNSIMQVPQFLPGSYELTLRVFDGRGGSAEDRMTLTITPIPEIVLHAVPSGPRGTWSHVQDATAASGVPVFNPDKGAPKVVTPLADPANYVDIWFVADPTQEYKLWIRGKAQNDSWANDSAWVQFDLSLDAGGATRVPHRHDVGAAIQPRGVLWLRRLGMGLGR